MELILHHLLESFTSRKYVYEKLVGNPGKSCNFFREIKVVKNVLCFHKFFAQFLIPQFSPVFRTFTRVPQLEYIGEANEEINNVRSIEECRNLCLEASVYQCRSATYDSNARVCRLTEETRRSAPSDFRIAERGVDYIENECSESE